MELRTINICEWPDTYILGINVKQGIAIVPYHATVNVAGSGMQTLYSNEGTSDLDGLLGQMLYNIGISYFSHLDFEQALYGKNLQVVDIKQPSEALVSADVIPTYLFGTVSKVDEGGVSIDVKRDIDIPLPIDGNTGRSIDYMNVSGLGSSSWESSILGSFFSTPTVSAVKLLNSAYKQGIPIYTINNSNMDTILPQLQVDPNVISAIQDAVNADEKVIIPQTNIQYYEWNGVGYIVYDPATGAGGYVISGGLAGASTSKPFPIQETNALYARLCQMQRNIIIETALFLVGTPYGFGKKDPASGYIDCSGLVAYCYNQIGGILTGGILTGGIPNYTTSLLNTNAQGQYNVTLPTDYPLYGDLVFFRGSYDKNHDCYINEQDGITHVGIALLASVFGSGMMIAAQSRGVGIYPVWGYLKEYKATSVTCAAGITPPDLTNGCNGYLNGCSYDNWAPTGRTFNSFMGYRYFPGLCYY